MYADRRTLLYLRAVGNVQGIQAVKQIIRRPALPDYSGNQNRRASKHTDSSLRRECELGYPGREDDSYWLGSKVQIPDDLGPNSLETTEPVFDPRLARASMYV